FGTNSAERQDNPSDSTKIYKWVLQEIRDTNNNYIKYTYFKDSGQIYPSTIIYTGNGTTDGIFQINIVRESRNDITVSYRSGFSVTTSYRIKEIDAIINGSQAFKYQLGFTTGD